MTTYRDVYYIFDDPIPFKSLLLYPIRMKDYLMFMAYSDCLTIDKNSIPDTKVIGMSYLEYILSGSTTENLWVGKLDRILRLCLNDKDGKRDIKYGYDENQKIFISIDGEKINGSDFDELKEIICEQQAIELEDYTIQKEVRDALKKAQEFKNRSSGAKMAGLEDQILCLVASTAMSVEDVSGLTIRKFTKLLERVDAKLHYEIYLAASMSGMVTFKDTSFIKHWMSDLSDKGKINSNLIDRDSIDSKLSGGK
jgi:hypothetical protein